LTEKQQNKYWFKAKKYGWGWTPSSWQGWTILIVFIIIETLLALNMNIFFPGTIVLVVLLILVCMKTGEKPGWRWGDKK
jgi:hypothetical protein